MFSDGGLGVPEPLTEFAQGMDPEATELSILSIAMVAIAVLLSSITLIASKNGDITVGNLGSNTSINKNCV